MFLLSDSYDESLGILLKNLYVYGVGSVVDAPATVQATQDAAERVSFIMETYFGKLDVMENNPMKHADTAYSNLALGAHTDTTFFLSPAGIQVFHCIHNECKGGETLLVDGLHVTEQLRQSNPDALWMLANNSIYHEYIESGHHYQSLAPIIKINSVSEKLELIRCNHYDRCPISTIPPEQISRYYDALECLSARISDKGNEHWFRLLPGTIMFLDNWRVLHGRAAFTGPRSLCGGYLMRDGYMDKGRVLGLF